MHIKGPTGSLPQAPRGAEAFFLALCNPKERQSPPEQHQKLQLSYSHTQARVRVCAINNNYIFV